MLAPGSARNESFAFAKDRAAAPRRRLRSSCTSGSSDQSAIEIGKGADAYGPLLHRGSSAGEYVRLIASSSEESTVDASASSSAVSQPSLVQNAQAHRQQGGHAATGKAVETARDCGDGLGEQCNNPWATVS